MPKNHHAKLCEDWFFLRLPPSNPYNRGMECLFLHKKRFWAKCDTCNFNSDKDKIKIHYIMQQSFTLFHNIDKIIEYKKILVKKTLWIVFKVWNSKRKNWRRSPRRWIIDSSSSVSISRAGVPLPALVHIPRFLLISDKR